MELSKLFFVLKVFRSQIFGEVGLAHFSNSLMQCEPIQFFDKFLDVLSVELGLPVDTFFDFDDEREVVFLAFGDVADEQVVREEPHLNVD